MGITTLNLDDVLSYHSPTMAQVEDIADVRAAAKEMCQVILKRCPICADQQAAIRKVREAMMTANAAIVLEGRV